MNRRLRLVLLGVVWSAWPATGAEISFSRHDAMFQMKTPGSPIKYFLEPVALSLNYLEKLGRGSFRLAVDESAPSHMISHRAIRDVILPALRGAP